MMEGISHEACSLAGTLGLGKLIAVYDDNGISIDSDKGKIRQWYTDDVRRRFEAYGWQVIAECRRPRRRGGGPGARKAKREKARPTLICCKTVIAQGRADQGQHRRRARRAARREGSRRHARGARLEVSAVRDPASGLRRLERAQARRGRRAALERSSSPPTQKQHPAEAAEFRRRMAGELPRGFRARALDALVSETERQGRDDRHAQGLAERARGARARAAGARRRLGRPHRLQPDAW